MKAQITKRRERMEQEGSYLLIGDMNGKPAYFKYVPIEKADYPKERWISIPLNMRDQLNMRLAIALSEYNLAIARNGYK
jgi:hypothetical protein